MNIKKIMGMGMLVVLILFALGCEERPGETWIPESPPSPEPEVEEPLVFESRQEAYRIIATTTWMEDVTLHEDSILSLSNEAYDSYLVMLKDSKRSFPRDIHLAYYGELIGKATLDTLENGEVTQAEQVELDGKSALRFYVRGGIDGVPITYLFYVFEELEDFYHLVAWSSSTNMERNQAYYIGILSSLEEVVEETPEPDPSDPPEAQPPSDEESP